MKSVLKPLAVAAIAATFASPALAYEAGQWILRAGIGQVEPESGNLTLASDLDVGGGLTLSSATLEVDSGTSLVLSATYMFTENWAFDILAAAPFEHDIDVSATVSDGTTSQSATVPLGDTSHLPPTFSVQYHFLPDADFQPYAGLGVNWTTFFSEGLTSEAQDLGFQDLELDDSFGIAAQLGADWKLNDNWLVNFDVRYINIETDATVTLDDGTGPVTGEIGTVDINPWVFAINVGYQF